MAALLVGACASGATGSAHEAPSASPPAASGQSFPDKTPPGHNSGATPSKPAKNPTRPLPTEEAPVWSGSPAPPPAPSASAPSPELGGGAGGASPNSCDATFELSGDTMYVHVTTDVDPPDTFYSGYLVDDENGHAVGTMYRGTDFSFKYEDNGAVVFIAVDAATLPPGTLTGPTGTLPTGMPYLWCETYYG